MKNRAPPGFFFVLIFAIGMREARSWDVFCRVLDNFGDAGVCWRLARQLANEHGARVRLHIDDLASLRALVPDIGLVARQCVEGVELRRWEDSFDEALGEVVVEAFGGGLPDAYFDAMTRAQCAPVWIVLEYLSAEPWVPAHHGLPSPHPREALERYFFFPGFVAGTGGLLREADLLSRRDAFDATAKAAFWRSIGFDVPAPDALAVSVFAYEAAPIRELLDAWESHPAPIVAAIPESRALPLVLDWFGGGAGAGRVLRRGALELRVIPFVPQREYDALLWSCDCNFVRGEDSFVRAQWAARPFVWHAYPQPDSAHARKLDAFLGLYTDGLDAGAARAAQTMMWAWNQSAPAPVTVRSAWADYAARIPRLRQHGLSWARNVAKTGDLALNLAQFCSAKLK
jgi:uncharacterized repeat protein (TIGR03837 family)